MRSFRLGSLWIIVVRVVLADRYNFCTGIKNCGSIIDGSQFDLSPLCNTNGGGWYGELKTGGGHEFVTNVCGNLADECQISQYCQLPGQAGERVDNPLCLTDTDAPVLGMAKQYGFNQTCEYGSEVAINTPCSRCNIVAPTYPADSILSYGLWSNIHDRQGNKLHISKGIQVTYPVVEMSPTQVQHPEWGKCGGLQQGYQTMLVFECDCSQISIQNDDVVAGVYQGPWNTALEGGSVPDPTNNCQFTFHFRSVYGCPIGWCDTTSPTSSPSQSWVPEPQQNRQQPAYVVSVVFISIISCLVIYLMLACTWNCIVKGTLGMPSSHFNLCTYFFSRLFCIRDQISFTDLDRKHSCNYGSHELTGQF